jgi:hypothetical protein
MNNIKTMLHFDGTSMLFLQNLINKMDSDLKNFQFEIQNISNKELIKLLETDKDELSVNVIQEKNVQVKKVQKERIERTQKISILLLIIGII